MKCPDLHRNVMFVATTPWVGCEVNSQKKKIVSRIERNAQLCTEKPSFIVLHSMGYGWVVGWGRVNCQKVWQENNEMIRSTEKSCVQQALQSHGIDMWESSLNGSLLGIAWNVLIYTGSSYLRTTTQRVWSHFQKCFAGTLNKCQDLQRKVIFHNLHP